MVGRRGWRTGAAAALLIAAPLMAGCVLPATPSHHGWLVHGQRATGDVASALSTTMLTLREEDHSRLVPNYARVAIAQAESTAGGAASAWGDEQPPRSEQQRASRISNTLDQANTLISQARTALLDNDPHACAQYCPKLQKMAAKVQKIEQRLSADADRTTVGH